MKCGCEPHNPNYKERKPNIPPLSGDCFPVTLFYSFLLMGSGDTGPPGSRLSLLRFVVGMRLTC